MDKYQAVDVLWNYLRMNQELSPVDAIIVFGNHDIQVAARGAELYLDGYAPIIIFTGGLGRITNGLWAETEAERFANIAIKMGVPEDKILLEKASTNSGDNIIFTKELIEYNNLKIEKIIAVHQPYMERRIFAAIKKKWDTVEVLVTSPQKNFQEYCAQLAKEGISENDVISIMVGDFQRVDVYAKKGFQIFQEIPKSAWDAFHLLVDMGFNKHVIIE